MREFDAVAVILWTALLVLIIIFATSCSSTEEMELAYDAQTKIVEAQSKISVKETLTVDCSQGCGNARISYTDPRDRRVIVPTVTNSNDVVKASIPSIITGVGFISGAIAGTRILKAFANNMGSGNTTTENNNITNGDDNNSTVNNSKTDSADTTVSSSEDNDSSVTLSSESTDTQDIDSTETNTTTNTADNDTTNTSNTTTTSTDDSNTSGDSTNTTDNSTIDTIDNHSSTSYPQVTAP